jgi:hypothetical protein
MSRVLTVILLAACQFLMVIAYASNLNAAKPLNKNYYLPWIPLLLFSGSSKPISGEWAGVVDFGRLEFNVAKEGTEINQIMFVFSNFSCGGNVINGTISVGTSIAILEGKFNYISNLTPSLKMTISGEFNDSGSLSYGTWEALSFSTTCKGIWQASPA